MLDLSVVILTRDEHLHIARCLEKLAPLNPRQMFVVDCISLDGTQRIAEDHGAIVVEHKWPGNHACIRDASRSNQNGTTGQGVSGGYGSLQDNCLQRPM